MTTDAAIRAAELHAAAFAEGGWSAAEIAGLAASPGGFLLLDPGAGFALGRVAGPEAELLMLVTHPQRRRRGHGAALLDRFGAEAAARGALEAFLEVAEDNRAALALYRKAGYAQVGRRRGYYAAEGGARRDAILMRRAPLRDAKS